MIPRSDTLGLSFGSHSTLIPSNSLAFDQGKGDKKVGWGRKKRGKG